jgi:hypothetical protein
LGRDGLEGLKSTCYSILNSREILATSILHNTLSPAHVLTPKVSLETQILLGSSLFLRVSNP